MNKLIVKGIKNIDGMKFHDIEGGFGEGKKAILAKEIASIHKRELKEINRRINDNRKRFKNGVDIIDLKGTEFEVILKHHGIYNQNSINRSDNLYVLSERGYAKLLKILEDDLAWEQYDKLVDGYFNMRAKKKYNSTIDVLMGTLQEMKVMQGEIEEAKKIALGAYLTAEEVRKQVNQMNEIVKVTNNLKWRENTDKLLSSTAYLLGDIHYIADLRRKVYELMEDRLSIDFNNRITRRTKRMMSEGVCKSKRDKINLMTIISEEKRLIEVYVSIVKEVCMLFKVGAYKIEE